MLMICGLVYQRITGMSACVKAEVHARITLIPVVGNAKQPSIYQRETRPEGEPGKGWISSRNTQTGLSSPRAGSSGTFMLLGSSANNHHHAA